MKVIYKSRGRGKTTELIEHAKTLKGYNLIVCSDRKATHRLWKLILEKKYDLPMPITFDEFINQQYCGRNINAFLIDDADLLIQYMSREVKIEAITLLKI